MAGFDLFFNWRDKVRRYGSFSADELRRGLFTILILAIIFSFKDMLGGGGYTALAGAIIVVGISWFVRQWVQKVWGLAADIKAEYRLWSYGLFIGLMVAFVTRGNIWFLLPGTLVFTFLPGHHIGWVRESINMMQMGFVSMAGPMANIVLAFIWRTLAEITGLALFRTAFLFNLAWALWTLIPIPPADGSRMFFGSRLIYIWSMAVVVTSAILLYLEFNIILTLIAAIALAWIWWLVYYLVWERYHWMGPY